MKSRKATLDERIRIVEYYLNKYDSFESLSKDIDFFSTKCTALKMGLAVLA